MEKTFLTAEWRQLVMLNYAVERKLLAPLVPRGVELDAFDGVCYVSVVGFLFLDTRIFGIAFPFHRDFEEVNLRFYVRQRAPEGWRRGVVFVKELVPRRAIAFLARTIYGEPYSAVPMSHEITERDGQTTLRFAWQRAGRTEFVAATTAGEPAFVTPGSLEEFITEHYWGYNTHRGRSTQYQVEHPSWRIWRATEPRFEADVRTLYGAGFVEALATAPASSFVAEGSEVIVRRGTVLTPHQLSS
ncbi:MAG: DUF2071 domain-containing protein [Chthoniobacterales bacterium]